LAIKNGDSSMETCIRIYKIASVKGTQKNLHTFGGKQPSDIRQVTTMHKHESCADVCTHVEGKTTSRHKTATDDCMRVDHLSRYTDEVSIHKYLGMSSADMSVMQSIVQISRSSREHVFTFATVNEFRTYVFTVLIGK